MGMGGGLEYIREIIPELIFKLRLKDMHFKEHYI